MKMDLNELAELYVSSFWVWAGLSIGIGAIFTFIFRMYNRTLRHWTLRKHGYPMRANIDADGDVIHPKKQEDE